MSLKKVTVLFLSLCIWMVCLAATSVKPESLRLIVFQGSDWCAQCILFEKNVLSDSLFINYTNAHSITIERIDFPQRTKLDSITQKHNEDMADKFNFQGQFPTVLLANSADSTMLKMNPNRNQSVSDFIAILKKSIPH